MIDHKGPSAAKPQLNRIISRKDAKAAKENGCHFDQGEKSFLDPSHSLGMTRIGMSLGDFAPWREEFPAPSAFSFQIICVGGANFEL
jgi:hypothetical protein